MDTADLRKTLAELNAESERIESLKKAYQLVAQHEMERQKKDAPVISPMQNTTESGDGVLEPQLVGKQPSKAKLVREALEKVKQHTFTLDDVAVFVPHGSMSRTDISFVLSTMKNKGKIELVTPGSGKTPSVYRKPSSPQTTDDHDPLFT